MSTLNPSTVTDPTDNDDACPGGCEAALSIVGLLPTAHLRTAAFLALLRT